MGYVELLEVLGDDATVARRARVLDYPEREWSLDEKLTRYMSDHEHTSPFEFVDTVWRMKLPIFVARQLIRHRTASVNEFSMRYAEPSALSEFEEIDYYTPSAWREQHSTNRQSSGDRLGGEDEKAAEVDYIESIEYAISGYYNLLKLGVAREQARMVLPLSVYTEWVWKMDLHNLLHMLKLRSAPDAQWETQQYANAMIELLREQFPKLMEVVWEQ